MNLAYLGVDPGASGAIALLSYDQPADWITLKNTEADIRDWLEDKKTFCDPVAALEQVRSMPGQGVASTFTFGRSYGFLRGLLCGLHIPYRDVRPQVWQRVFISAQKSESKTDHKRRLKQAAQQLWPDIKITNATADALLLAEWLRRTL